MPPASSPARSSRPTGAWRPRSTSTAALCEMEDLLGGLEPRRDLAVAADGDEVHAVERAGRTDLLDEVAGQVDSDGPVVLEAIDDRGGHGELGDVGGELA